jgi:hypothetical protein
MWSLIGKFFSKYERQIFALYFAKNPHPGICNKEHMQNASAKNLHSLWLSEMSCHSRSSFAETGWYFGLIIRSPSRRSSEVRLEAPAEERSL